MKKAFTVALLLALSVMLFSTTGLGAESAADAAEHSVQFDIEGEAYIVEVGEITPDDAGRPSVTLTSHAISGSISMSANTMAPFVACAVLANGEIVDPILLAGGVVNGSGYAAEGKNVLMKTPSPNALGKWEDDTKGYLSYCFDTQEPIVDILIGTYADYADSNYDAFLSSEVASQ